MRVYGGRVEEFKRFTVSRFSLYGGSLYPGLTVYDITFSSLHLFYALYDTLVCFKLEYVASILDTSYEILTPS